VPKSLRFYTGSQPSSQGTKNHGRTDSQSLSWEIFSLLASVHPQTQLLASHFQNATFDHYDLVLLFLHSLNLDLDQHVFAEGTDSVGVTGQEKMTVHLRNVENWVLESDWRALPGVGLFVCDRT
jgi:hypothetical protein